MHKCRACLCRICTRLYAPVAEIRRLAPFANAGLTRMLEIPTPKLVAYLNRDFFLDMDSEEVSVEKLAIKDTELEELLDAVDNRTQQQQVFHDLLSDGFLSLARERYRDPLSTERLGRLVYDLREDVTSSLQIDVQEDEKSGMITMNRTIAESNSASVATGSTLRRRRANDAGNAPSTKQKTVKARPDVANSFVAIPSSEVREAIRCFKMAIDQAVELVNTNNKLVAKFDDQ
ncbi:hypothetical protein FGB62_131g026 [Gracilaria domingensis]|nr:hypothetical protein FGB62_131g026 [Gracilaria domingensis]